MIIGISGYAGVGKDTVAGIIRDLDNSFEIKKFSGALKEVASILTGVPSSNFENQWFKNQYLHGWDMTARELLQRLGTDAIRDGLHKDAWVNALMNNYHQDDNWIITDMRFKNEYDAIKRFGGIVVRLHRDEIKPINAHCSETELDGEQFDYTLVNNKDVDGWEDIVYGLMESVWSKQKTPHLRGLV